MKKGYLYIGLTTILFSTMEIALKQIGQSFNPIQLTLSRFLVGGLILLPFALKYIKQREISISIEDIKQFALLGFICVVVSMSLYQMAVGNTKASVVAVLFSCNPVFTIIFAYLILKENIDKYNVLSLLLQVIGIIIIINPLHTKLSTLGISLTLLAAITFSIYGVLGKKLCSKLGGLVVTCGSFILGSIEMLLIVLLGKIDFISDYLSKTPLSVFAEVPLLQGYSLEKFPYIIYIYIFVTGIGFMLYFKGMEETSASIGSLVFFFKPVLSPILAFIILKEIIPVNMIIGIIFIIIGAISSILPKILSEKSSYIENVE